MIYPLRKSKYNKNLGQHFLTDELLVNKIIDLSDINKDKVVLEVGSGTGIFTKRLCLIAKYVYSFELDRYLFYYCKNNLHFSNLFMINSDCFDTSFHFNFDVFFSSLPYYESRNAILWLCQKKIKKALLVLQKEFVQKLLSPPGKKNYRAISIITQSKFYINVLLDIPRTSFSPPPKVNSVLVELIPKDFSISKENIRDIQFLLSFRKKNISSIFKFYRKNPLDYINEFDFNKYKNEKLGNIDVQTIIKLSNILYKDTDIFQTA